MALRPPQLAYGFYPGDVTAEGCPYVEIVLALPRNTPRRVGAALLNAAAVQRTPKSSPVHSGSLATDLADADGASMAAGCRDLRRE